MVVSSGFPMRLASAYRFSRSAAATSCGWMKTSTPSSCARSKNGKNSGSSRFFPWTLAGNQHGWHAVLLDDAIQLSNRFTDVLQRQNAHAHHASRKARGVFGDRVIDDLTYTHADGSGSPEREERRQHRFNDHIDLLRGHLSQAPLRVDQARA